MASGNRLSNTGRRRLQATGFLAGLLGFLVLSLDDVTRGPFYRADFPIDAWMSRATAAAPGLHALGQALSQPGTWVVDSLAAAGSVVALWLLRQRRLAILTVGFAAGVGLLATGLKMAFHRPLPPEYAPLSPGDFAFPSGHALGATAVLGVAIMLAANGYVAAKGLEGKRRNRILSIALAVWLVLAATTGVGRILSQTHWTSDVLAAWLLGAAIVCLALLVCSREPFVDEVARGLSVSPTNVSIEATLPRRPGNFLPASTRRNHGPVVSEIANPFSAWQGIAKACVALILGVAVLLPGLYFSPYLRWLSTFLFLALLFLGTRALVAAFMAFRSPARPPPKPDSVGWPTVSILVPAYNEANVLPATMESMHSIDYPANLLQFVYVYEAACSDATPLIITQRAATDPRFVAVERRGGRPGKAAAFNQAAAHCTGEILIGLDADQVLKPDAVKRAAQWFIAEPELAAVKARPLGVNGNHSVLASAAKVERDAIERGDTYLRQLVGGFTFFGGGQVAFRRSAFQALGGYAEDVLLEDMDLSWRIHAAGLGLRFDPAFITYEEHPTGLGDWWMQRHRWSRGGMQVARRCLPQFSHWRRFPWPRRLDFVQTFSFALLAPLFILLLPLGLLDRLGVPARTLLPQWLESVGWAVLLLVPPTAFVCTWYQDRREGIRHDRREWVTLPLLGVYAALHGLVTGSAFLDEFVLHRPNVFIKTHKAGIGLTWPHRQKSPSTATRELDGD